MFAVMMQASSLAWSPWVLGAFLLAVLLINADWTAVTRTRKAMVIALLVLVFGLVVSQDAYAVDFYWDWCYHGWFC